ncbi:D-amino-acid transaminase [Bauldia sp.]|uniref:D-amino-acid transaminase n=1 Tax=Bauldia sp. TaxID=2575872 RepID=UPI003BA9A2F6
MSRIAYVNGRYVPHRQAMVHIEDRGFQFADAVYEVCEVRNGRLIDEAAHLARLRRSLSELRMAEPMSLPALGVLLREIIKRNRIVDGIVYVQVTRGVAPRRHAFPPPDTKPGLVLTAHAIDRDGGEQRSRDGVSVVTLPDNRWGRVDIKTVGLLPNALARQSAIEAGSFEALFVDRDGFITEGAATNVWIVTEDGTLITRPADHGILRGITRGTILRIAESEGIKTKERRFTVDEACHAREVFLTGSSVVVMPVVRIDDKPVGNGRPGPVATRLRAIFHDNAQIATLWSSFAP